MLFSRVVVAERSANSDLPFVKGSFSNINTIQNQQ